MRVLSIVPTGQVFGLQHATLSLFSEIPQGIDAHFLVTRWTDGEFASTLRKFGIPFSYSWLGFFSKQLNPDCLRMTSECLVKLPALYRDFLALIRDYRPDLIYTANNRELILLSPVLPWVKIPVICHMHDLPPLRSFQRLISPLWKGAADYFLALSQSVFRGLERFGIAAKRVSLLYNGIDLTEFPYRPLRTDLFTSLYQWPKEAVILGMTGQMIPDKGHLDLIEAVRILHQRIPELRVVIGGKEGGDYYNRLRRLVSDLELDEVVRFSGWQEEVRNFFAGIDFFVLPSRHEEGFGLVSAQAMATGRPVIVSNSGGAPEVTDGGKRGLVVEKRNPVQLAGAIHRLAGSAALRLALGEEGRRRVERDFDLNAQRTAFWNILKERVHQYSYGS